MAKARHDQEPKSSNATMAILVGGIVLVAALIVWAMTRTVEPETSTASAGYVAPPDTAATAPPSATSATSPINPALPTTLPGSTATAAPSQQLPAAAQGDTAGVTRIAAEDLKAKLDRGEVTVIDVRDGPAFAQEHIPGAVSMPLATVEAQVASLPKGKAVVTYCT
jgi:hypothetical protein